MRIIHRAVELAQLHGISERHARILARGVGGGALDNMDRDDVSALIPEDVANEIIKAVPAESAVLTLPRVRRKTMSRKQQRLPIVDFLPDAFWVSEGGTKEQTKGAWTNLFVTAEELAVIVTIDEAALDDSDYDIWGELKPTIVESIGQKIDQAVLFGTDAPASFPNSIVEGAVAASNEVVEGTGRDYAEDVNLAFGEVEVDGYEVNGAVARLGVKQKLRGLRDDQGQPIFVTSLRDDQKVDSLYGEALTFSRNGAWEPDDADMIVGDWSALCFAVRQDLRWKVADQATVGGVSLFETDRVALRVTFRCGFQILNPPNRENPNDATRYPFAIIDQDNT